MSTDDLGVQAKRQSDRVGGTVVDGLSFTECPRWHEGRLWFVDMHLHQVVSVEADGSDRQVIDVPDSPGGIGWLPDGRLLVVQMNDRTVLRRQGDSFVVHADLSDVVPSTINDLAVDSAGRAYVGETGFDPHPPLEDPHTRAEVIAGTFVSPALGRLFLIDVDGTYREVASGLSFPNGIVVEERSATLFVAESFSARLSRYRIHEDGRLTDRTELFLGFAPDGIGYDRREGRTWVSDVFGHAAVAVDHNGVVVERVQTDQLCLASEYGGKDGDTLFLCTSPSLKKAECLVARGSQIEVYRTA